MKRTPLDFREALVRPATRTLLGLLIRSDAPVRVKAAREELRLSISQIGLAMRSLERCGLALRRTLVSDNDALRLQHLYLEATDLGREQAQAVAGPSTPVAPPPQV